MEIVTPLAKEVHEALDYHSDSDWDSENVTLALKVQKLEMELSLLKSDKNLPDHSTYLNILMED